MVQLGGWTYSIGFILDENIHVNGRGVRIDREPRFTYLVERFNIDYGANFCQIDMEKFKVNLSKPILCIDELKEIDPQEEINGL